MAGHVGRKKLSGVTTRFRGGEFDSRPQLYPNRRLPIELRGSLQDPRRRQRSSGDGELLIVDGVHSRKGSRHVRRLTPMLLGVAGGHDVAELGSQDM